MKTKTIAAQILTLLKRYKNGKTATQIAKLLGYLKANSVSGPLKALRITRQVKRTVVNSGKTPGIFYSL